MEFVMLNREDQPPNSIEPELQDGRSYECMYCKHGFTNAQALGGHMNVHRKDRAKNKSNSSNSKRSFRDYEPCLMNISGHQQEGQTREFMVRSNPTIYGDQDFSKYQNPDHGMFTSPSREEVRLSLSLQFDRLKEGINQGGNEDDELDLELRLGKDP